MSATSPSEKKAKGRAGFSLVEILIAMSLSLLVTAIVVPGYVWILRMARSGSLQAKYNTAARMSEERIDRFVRDGRAVSVTAHGIRIMTISNTVAAIEYADLDGNADTLSNNVLRYYPDVNVDASEVLCSDISPIPGESMFTNPVISTLAVQFNYHVGEGTNPACASAFSASPGYQGVEVRFCATPRNLQQWYD